MRLFVLLASTSLLAACGGGGAETISSAPPPTGGTGTATTHSFADPTETKTYKGVGSQQVMDYLTDSRECCDQQGITYAGNAATVRQSGISIKYEPNNATYTLIVNDPLTGAAAQTRFQDPANRTDFGGDVEPQWGTPHLSNPNIRYLQAGDGDPRSLYESSGTGLVDPGTNEIPASGEPGSSYQAANLFLLKPGTETKYVSFAGYVRNALSFETLTVAPPEGDPDANPDDYIFDLTNWHLERGAFAFGEVTPNDKVPTAGTGSYSGSMLASMIFNPTLDGEDPSGLRGLPSYFQWIEGSADVQVNFATNTFNLDLDGTVLAPQIDRWTGPELSIIKEGATFAASGKGDINMVNFGGFKGFFESARFTNPAGDSRTVAIEGSTIDGTFYGPNGEEIGGGYRIVGGNPDERVDIVGTFVGTK